MGFGVTSSTILITFGISPAIAGASVHAAEAVVDLLPAVVHHKLGHVDNDIWLRMAVPGVIAAVLGASALSWLSMSMAKPLVRVILIVMGGIVLYRHAIDYRVKKIKLTDREAVVLGFVAGFHDVLGGGGWAPSGLPASYSPAQSHARRRRP